MSDGSERGSTDRFDDAEVRMILSRAAELNERRSAAAGGDAGTGLDLQQLREVAAEAGIDPDLINIAAHEVRTTGDAGPPTTVNPAGRFRYRLETTVPGTLTPDRLEWVLRAIRSATDEKGEIDHVGGQMEWKGEKNKLKVALGSRAGNTRIEVASDLTDGVNTFRGIVTTMGTFFGGGIVAAALDASSATPFIFLLVGVVLFFLTGWMSRRHADDHEQKLRHILESAAAAAADGTAALPSGEGPA